MLTLWSTAETTDKEILVNAKQMARKAGVHVEVFEHIFVLERNLALLQKKVELLEKALETKSENAAKKSL